MSKSATITLYDQQLELHPFHAAYWQERKTLLLADMHLGKAAHFRREGIPVPLSSEDENLDKLISLLIDFQPERVLFLGDLFHSVYNQVWEELSALIRQFSDVKFILVRGNHDILEAAHYEKAGLKVQEEPWLETPFLWSHHPLEAIPKGTYNIAGHIHPGIVLRGKGRQSLKLPCFFFGENQGLLPAFGAFTGLYTISAITGDSIFVVADNEVIPVF